MIETIQIVVDESPMNMLVATPAGDAPAPGILLSHYQHGLGPFTRRNVARLASEGFVVVAPDHYHHTPDEPDLKLRKLGLIDTRLIADMMAATAYLRSHPRTIPERTAIMGHCMGGRQTLLGAATVPGFRCAIDCYGGGVLRAQGPGPTVFERLSGVMRDQSLSTAEVDAVMCMRPVNLGQVPKQLEAVRAFAVLPESPALAAANKRIGNILKKAGEVDAHVNAALLQGDAEKNLYVAMQKLLPESEAQFKAGDYTASLQTLATLRAPVDAFFEDVMVNAEEMDLRLNRQGLLKSLHVAMNRVADLSKLAT